jgi:two-component system NtrC family sensor kinase
VQIEIVDNGGGIPQDIAQKIFDPFFTTKDPDKGTGLGLSISKSIVEEFHGTLSFSSENGHTTLTITLPTQQAL